MVALGRWLLACQAYLRVSQAVVNHQGRGSNLSSRDAQDFYLRVMPLGASITEGLHSTDSNGYRKALRDQLRWKGWNVNMVGSQQNGNMTDYVRAFCSNLTAMGFVLI